MTQEQVDFIDAWEVESYRRKISAGANAGRAENKIIVVTGAAQGFGEGIARCLVKEGANVNEVSNFRGNDDRREGKTQNEIFIAPHKKI
jgi:hypothetical protein